MASTQHRVTSKGEHRWRIVFRLHGTQRVVTFASQAAADEWRRILDAAGPARALRMLAEDKPTGSGRSVAEHVTEHIEHLTGITEGTRSDYRAYLRLHIAPHIGGVPVEALTRNDVAGWVNTLAATLAPKTVKNVHGLLSAALARGVDSGDLVVNVAHRMRLPARDETVEMVTLTEPEILEFVGCVKERWRPLVVTLVGTGMRWGEATALTVGDVDLDAATARIRQAWKHTDGHGHVLGPPKSRRSRRTLALPPGVVLALAPLVQGRRGKEFVFTNARGGPVRLSAFHETVWTPAVRAFAGDTAEDVATGGRPRRVWTQGQGKRPRVHDMRHTYASAHARRGKPMVWLQRQLGHESIATTERLYTHLYTADLAALGDVADWSALALGPAT